MSIAVGKRIYCIGGYLVESKEHASDVQIYDTETNTWSLGTQAPAGFQHMQPVAIGSALFFPGGSRYATESWFYNTETDTWTTGKGCPANIFDSSAATILSNRIGNYGYVAYPQVPESQHCQIFRYDIQRNVWSEETIINDDRKYIQSAVVANSIYYIGGQLDGSRISNVDIYTPHEITPPDPDPSCTCPAKVKIQIEACNGNKLIKDICGLIQESDCDCTCECK